MYINKRLLTHETITIDLALMMKKLLTCYDNLFNTSFPYTMGWHGNNIQYKPAIFHSVIVFIFILVSILIICYHYYNFILCK